MIATSFEKEENLGYLFVDYFMKSKLWVALRDDPKDELARFMLDAVFHAVPDFSGLSIEYSSGVNDYEDIILSFGDGSIYITCPVKLYMDVDYYQEEMLALQGKVVDLNYQEDAGIALRNVKFDSVEEYSGTARIKVTADLFFQVKIMDRISDTFTSKGGRNLKRFGV